jgi:hypothetical protein
MLRNALSRFHDDFLFSQPGYAAAEVRTAQAVAGRGAKLLAMHRFAAVLVQCLLPAKP